MDLIRMETNWDAMVKIKISIDSLYILKSRWMKNSFHMNKKLPQSILISAGVLINFREF